MSPLSYGVFGLAILAMVWPAAPPKVKPGLAGSEWRIVEIGGTKASGAGTVRFTQTSVRGKAPCNSFFGAFRENAGTIEIAGINGTRMLCAGRMELEQTFLEGLARVRGYRLDGGTLSLIDAGGLTIARLAA